MTNLMKPELKELRVDPHVSFDVKVDSGKDLLNSWHYHPELELILLRGTTGKRIIGQSLGRFNSGDIFLIGKNTPHAFIHERLFVEGEAPQPQASPARNEAHKKREKASRPETLVIKFQEDFLGEQFLQLSETQGIKELFSRAAQGLSISAAAKKKIAPLMEKMLTAAAIDRLLLLLQLLHIISAQDSYSLLTGEEKPEYRIKADDEMRIRKIFEYTEKHYNQSIRIEEVAHMINLTRESFCRYFKAQTRKTYFEYLTSVRISEASRMLRENRKSIKEIGYCCGYDNLSNFYRQFKKVKNLSPLEYKSRYFGWVGKTA